MCSNTKLFKVIPQQQQESMAMDDWLTGWIARWGRGKIKNRKRQERVSFTWLLLLTEWRTGRLATWWTDWFAAGGPHGNLLLGLPLSRPYSVLPFFFFSQYSSVNWDSSFYSFLKGAFQSVANYNKIVDVIHVLSWGSCSSSLAAGAASTSCSPCFSLQQIATEWI